MSRTILALALASSVSALLPAMVPVRVRGVYSTPLASSSALLSMRSRSPYMSIDPDTHAKIAAAGYSSGFSDGLKAATNVGAPNKVAETGLVSTPESRAKLAATTASGSGSTPVGSTPVGISGVDGPLLQTLATVCCTIDDVGTKPTKRNPYPKRDPLKAKYVPVDGKANYELDQPYKLDRASGVTDGSLTDGGVTALKAFITALAPYGTVIDSITDWHDELEVAIPPFAALVVQPPEADGKASNARAPPARLPPPLISHLKENVVRLR